jgi:hypothetical protein
MKRFQARRSSGRFTRNTTENTFGLSMNIHGRKADGSWCGALNPSKLGEERPTVCNRCGEKITPETAE